MRAQHQSDVSILGVHHVEEGKFRIRAGGWQQLKEGIMPIVVRIIVAGSIGIPCPQPGLQRRDYFWLEPGLHVECAGSLCLHTPPPGLYGAPEQQVHGAGVSLEGMKSMTAEGLDADVR